MPKATIELNQKDLDIALKEYVKNKYGIDATSLTYRVSQISKDPREIDSHWGLTGVIIAYDLKQE